MRQLVLLSTISITLFACSGGNSEPATKDNTIVKEAVQPATQKETTQENKLIAADRKVLTLTSPGFYFGDIGHLTFKDQATNKEAEYEYAEEVPAIAEIINKCSDPKGCPSLKGEMYTATLDYKLMDITDWDGEKLVPTGKKEKRWILVDLQKIKK